VKKRSNPERSGAKPTEVTRSEAERSGAEPSKARKSIEAAANNSSYLFTINSSKVSTNATTQLNMAGRCRRICELFSVRDFVVFALESFLMISFLFTRQRGNGAR